MKIGLTKTENEIKHQYYVNWLKGADTIEIITLAADNDTADTIKDCDALVLSGGVDIYPPLYGTEELNYNNAPIVFRKTRDEFEISVFRSAIENNIPVLGVCRGSQLINCVMGGTLKQDLSEEGNEVHWAEKKPGDKAHVVHIENNSLLHNITRVSNGIVNSAHHQAIDTLGEGLTANCMAEDGTIEGIEWKDKNNKAFMLAVQWHPERMFQSGLQDTPLTKEIRDHFIEEIQKVKLKKNEFQNK